MKAYVTADKCGNVVVSQHKPRKGKHYWYETQSGFFFLINPTLLEGINPQWSNDEPIEVELKIEKI